MFISGEPAARKALAIGRCRADGAATDQYLDTLRPALPATMDVGGLKPNEDVLALADNRRDVGVMQLHGVSAGHTCPLTTKLSRPAAR